MATRRWIIQHGLKAGLAAATAPLWSSPIARRAFAQNATSPYKAVLLITLVGGNDGNNLLIPLDSAEFSEYIALRTALAISGSVVIPLPGGSGSPTFGLHPALKNVAALYTQKRAAIVANIGPLAQPASKQQLTAAPALQPQSLFDHPAGQRQWESATTLMMPQTGWGGRIADLISGRSGSLPPVLNTAVNSLFQVGNTVQGIAVQSGGAYPALPPGMSTAILQIALNDSTSTIKKVAATASLRASAMQQQALLDQAMSYMSLKQTFTSSQLGASLKAVAQLLSGRSVIGADRQLFYARHVGFDTHEGQLPTQNELLSDFDANIGSFFGVLDDLGLSDSVLVCTHSDFSRTMTSNTRAGSDHAWGNHQLILGGGLNGGRIIGKYPTLDLGGPDDFGGQGIWIPTLSVTQMTGAIGGWLGLTHSQLTQVFPDLANFPAGPIQL